MDLDLLFGFGPLDAFNMNLAIGTLFLLLKYPVSIAITSLEANIT